jgi:LytS/YehU family sensor histidine kinase
MWAALQFYLFYFIVYKLIEKQQYYRYFLWSVVIAVVLSLILFYVYLIIFAYSAKNFLVEISPPIIGTFIIGHTGSLLKGFIRWFEDIGKKQELEKMMLKNELDALNAQLNPHFLFNTLNNIDSLIQSNPPKASESLISLSEIMRYMLYTARKTKVSLLDEINHYRNIVNLQLLRMKDPSKVIFTNETANSNIHIAPLIFLPFIENAFKYTSFETEHTAIHIELTENNKKVFFSCKNLIDHEKVSNNKSKSGIGLKNLKKRLEILYKGNYNLLIKQDNLYFAVQLTINA